MNWFFCRKQTFFDGKAQWENLFCYGGANGIGRAVVTALHRAGASVAFCDVDRGMTKKMIYTE